MVQRMFRWWNLNVFNAFVNIVIKVGAGSFTIFFYIFQVT